MGTAALCHGILQFVCLGTHRIHPGHHLRQDRDESRRPGPGSTMAASPKRASSWGSPEWSSPSSASSSWRSRQPTAPSTPGRQVTGSHRWPRRSAPQAHPSVPWRRPGRTGRESAVCERRSQSHRQLPIRGVVASRRSPSDIDRRSEIVEPCRPAWSAVTDLVVIAAAAPPGSGCGKADGTLPAYRHRRSRSASPASHSGGNRSGRVAGQRGGVLATPLRPGGRS